MKPRIMMISMKSNLRTMRHIGLLLMFIFCLTAQNMMAQRGKLFNSDNQLSSNLATQVFQDSNGFIWIATRNGLNIYDGYNFTTIRKTKEDHRGLSSNYINCITQDIQGHILLGTNNSLLLYNGKSFANIPLLDSKNQPVSTYVTQVYRLKNNDIAVVTSGYGIMLKKENAEVCYAMKGEVENLKFIHKILEDKQERLWIILESGKLCRADKKRKLTKQIPGTETLEAQDIQQDAKGNIYLATKNDGVYLLKVGSTVFTKIAGIGNLPIESIYISRDQRLFIGCDGMGIFVYNPTTGFLQNNPLFSREVNLAKSKVTSIIEDFTGNIWVSMMQKGVLMQPQAQCDFNYMGFRLGNRNVIGENSVTSLCVNQGNQVWVGTDKDGLYLFDLKTSSINGHFFNNTTVLALCKDQKGRTWVGTYTDGIGFIDAGGSFHPFDLGFGKQIGIFDIQKDPQGNIWFATMGEGLFRLSPDGNIKQWKAQYGADNNLKKNSIPNDYLVKLSISKDGKRVFVATSVGLACYDQQKNSWTSTFGGVNCLNKGCFSHCVYADSKNRVWFGTEDGAICYDPKKGFAHPKIYNTETGLSDNSAASIIEDYKGRIWIGTTCGLNQVNTEKGTINKYFSDNGLQSNEFSDAAACTLWGGKMLVMGGTGGINWFDTDKVKQHPWQAKVTISGLLVDNKPVYRDMESGIYTITDKGVYNSDKFSLSHEDNTFTIQLSTLTYNNVEQISYAYSINGEDWRTIQSGMNELSFSHMPAGTYKFRVKAICNGYETPVKEFSIIVHPAWYASIWAKLCYLLAFLGLCLLYIKHRKRKMEDQLILQQHIHAEEMGEAKLKFFMNISHEIRTPLTLILTPLFTRIKEDKDAHRQGIYDMMRKNSERILHLINQMMDLRKIDKGQMVMHMSETDMVAFIGDEYKLFCQQAIAKSIQFTFEHEDETLPVWIDRDNFDKVLMNVLSNAFKFTPAGGRIRITLSHSPHHVRIAIKDSGKGIQEEKLETIFQRFYQSATTSNDRNVGTGIGLDLTRSLVELHYGTITAANNKTLDEADWKEGSQFLITLPLGNEHLKPEEMIDAPEPQTAEDIKELEENMEEGNEENAADTANDAEEDFKSKVKSTIAVVEDDEAIRNFLKTQLQGTYNILTFCNGKEALPEIIKQKPNLVISDIMMPEMDGNTLCTKIKNNVNTNHIPVILLTAMSREEDQLTGLQSGADAYVVKPFNMDILRRTIINLLNVRRTLKNKFMGNERQSDKQIAIEKDLSPKDQLMEQVMKVINDNMDNEDLSVDMIAREVGLSRVHLHRRMKELTNQTPHAFIRNTRLQYAEKLLSHSNKTITDIMYACGFSNPASFSTMFKNFYGSSPRDYMQAHRKI